YDEAPAPSAIPISTGFSAGPISGAVAALLNGEVVGGVTAHTLPMTRSEAYEVFIFDVAVQNEYQRQGIGRQLIAALRAYAAAEGIHEVFVPADNDDVHALDFYQALGGVPAPVTIFTFSADTDD
ncbi:MAG: GNAT family N-acetyltransferase, partial [Anaerolineales bacterium]|nr:GNAT family N-acetyltransferase [Anaerolineales bacterium]